MEEDKELEEIKKRKLSQLMAQQQVQQQEEKEERVQRNEILRTILTPEARERLNRVKMVKPDVVEAVENQLIYIAQTGKLDHMITDEEMKNLLFKLTAKKRDIKIERR